MLNSTKYNCACRQRL